MRTGKGKGRDPEVEAFWREQVRRWQQSGSSVRQFCREEGLAAHSMYFWKREIRRRDAEGKGKSEVSTTATKTKTKTKSKVPSASAGGASPSAVGTTEPRFAELLLAGASSRLEADEVEVHFRDGTAVRFRGGCPLTMVECVLAALGQASSASERRTC